MFCVDCTNGEATVNWLTTVDPVLPDKAVEAATIAVPCALAAGYTAATAVVKLVEALVTIKFVTEKLFVLNTGIALSPVALTLTPTNTPNKRIA
jgi:hypothetical protein